MLLSGHTGRREVIALLGGTAVGLPLGARAQQPDRMRRIGALMHISESDREGQARIKAFRQSLEALGWVEGRNLTIEYRWTGGDPQRARSAASEMASLAPEVILSHSGPMLSAIRDATRTVPIVFVQVVDPVGQGFVESLARPGGNITGFTHFEPEMGGKWLEILKEVAPQVRRVAMLYNPRSAAEGAGSGIYLRSFETIASALAVHLVAFAVRDPTEMERSLAAIYPYRYYVLSGGLIAYGVDLLELYPRAADYVDRILKGARPGDLPIAQPTKFQLIVNLKIAKALGLTIPESFLLRADEVIE